MFENRCWLSPRSSKADLSQPQFDKLREECCTSHVRIDGFRIGHLANFSRIAAIQIRGLCGYILVENGDIQWVNYGGINVADGEHVILSLGRAGLRQSLAFDAAAGVVFQDAQTLGRIRELPNFGAQYRVRLEASPVILATLLCTLQRGCCQTRCHTRYRACGQELLRRGSHPLVFKPFPVRSSNIWFMRHPPSKLTTVSTELAQWDDDSALLLRSAQPLVARMSMNARYILGKGERFRLPFSP